MGTPAEDRAKAAELPDGDVVRILLEQHARIRELFEEVVAADAEHRQRPFDELRALLAVHETAEEMILRPVSSDAAGSSVVDARNHEEAAANEVLKRLEKMDVGSPEFGALLMEFQKSVEEHAEAEEQLEFPAVLASCDEDKRRAMGRMLRAAEAVAPTHPHPSTAGSTAAQYAVGPFASLVDRTRDLIGKATG